MPNAQQWPKPEVNWRTCTFTTSGFIGNRTWSLLSLVWSMFQIWGRSDKNCCRYRGHTDIQTDRQTYTQVILYLAVGTQKSRLYATENVTVRPTSTYVVCFMLNKNFCPFLSRIIYQPLLGSFWNASRSPFYHIGPYVNGKITPNSWMCSVTCVKAHSLDTLYSFTWGRLAVPVGKHFWISFSRKTFTSHFADQRCVAHGKSRIASACLVGGWAALLLSANALLIIVHCAPFTTVTVIAKKDS